MSDHLVAQTATYSKHSKHKRRTSMPSVGFKPAVPAIDRTPTGISHICFQDDFILTTNEKTQNKDDSKIACVSMFCLCKASCLRHTVTAAQYYQFLECILCTIVSVVLFVSCKFSSALRWKFSFNNSELLPEMEGLNHMQTCTWF